jgi:hypothetical protein
VAAFAFAAPFRSSSKPCSCVAAALRDLFAGRFGYRLVASFESPAALPLRDLRATCAS